MRPNCLPLTVDAGKPMAYMWSTHKTLLTIIETSVFLRRAKDLLSEEERLELGAYLAENSSAGAIMEGTGGIRKLRWARPGSGKSGGFRIIYYYHSDRVPLFLLDIFAKNEKANLSMAERNTMKKLTLLLAQYGRNI